MAQGNIEDIARGMARLLCDKKCEHAVLLAVGPVSSIADYFIIATATSRAHMRACADDIEAFAASHAVRPLTRPANHDGSVWTLIDLGSIVLHLFTAEGRAYYDLDKVWFEAERIPFE
ncbi:MAG: ribosome silencing factor [Spirochaetota bacterium]